MKIPFWLLPNVLSLDAPAIALLWQGFFAVVFQTRITPAARWSLGFTVWAIYIADRLLDTRKATSKETTARHEFHRRHRGAMGGLLAANVLSATVVSFLAIRPVVFRAGLPIVGGVALYLYAVHRGYLLKGKELVVALLFSAGTIVAPLARADRKAPVLIAGAAFFIACLANLSVIEAVETRGRQAPWFWTGGLLLLGLCSSYDDVGLRLALLAAGSSLLGLAALYWKRRSVSKDVFRVLADIALLSPLPIWLLYSP